MCNFYSKITFILVHLTMVFTRLKGSHIHFESNVSLETLCRSDHGLCDIISIDPIRNFFSWNLPNYFLVHHKTTWINRI